MKVFIRIRTTLTFDQTGAPHIENIPLSECELLDIDYPGRDQRLFNVDAFDNIAMYEIPLLISIEKELGIEFVGFLDYIQRNRLLNEYYIEDLVDIYNISRVGVYPSWEVFLKELKTSKRIKSDINDSNHYYEEFFDEFVLPDNTVLITRELVLN